MKTFSHSLTFLRSRLAIFCAAFLLSLAGSTATLNATPVVAPIAVTTNADSGAGSLRAAITSANGTSGSTITFGPLFVSQQTITLASALPTLTANMTITGPGAALVTISGNNARQVFNVGNFTVVMSGVTIANGNVAGRDRKSVV